MAYEVIMGLSASYAIVFVGRLSASYAIVFVGTFTECPYLGQY